MLVCYSLESRSHWFVLLFAGACALGSAYGFLQGAWPVWVGRGGVVSGRPYPLADRLARLSHELTGTETHTRPKASTVTVRALRNATGPVSKQRERVQFLARRFAKVFQWIDALAGSHRFP
jgi:hypothetical protein